MRKNIAVVGAGYWGKNLVRNFFELGALHTICETSEERIKYFSLKYPDVSIEKNYQKVFCNPEIEGVVLATPAATHYILAREALRSGKDVFVEKPLCLDPAEGRRLCEIAGREGRILMVGHLLHYHPAVKKIKEYISTGKLGKIHHIYSNRLNLGIFRSEENVLWSFAPHDISVILSLFDTSPQRVSAIGTSSLRHGIADTVHLSMDFGEGLYGNVFVSWLHPFKEQRMVISGERGMLVYNDTAKEDKLLYYRDPVLWEGTGPVPVKNNPESVAVEVSEPLKEECMAFLQAVLNRNEPLTCGEEGLTVLKALAAAQTSLDRGGEWIITESATVEGQYFAHPTAVIDEGCSIGAGTKIWHFSHVMTGAEIGEQCNIGQNVVVSQGVKIGRNVKIQNNVSVYTGVVCEDDVFLGPSMVFTNIKTPRSAYPRNTRDDYLPTVIKKGASIGANATIICGVTIGCNAMVGAGSVVTEDVPDYAVVYGNPARINGWVCRCGNVIAKEKKQLLCSGCMTGPQELSKV